MNPARKQRLTLVILVVFGIGMASGFALYALKQNINLFYTPTQLLAAHVPFNKLFRLGGMVKTGSVHYASQGIDVSFVLTDLSHEISVKYHGVLPDLFREGQGIVAEGKLNSAGVFVAQLVLAKHDEKYMPYQMHKDNGKKVNGIS